MRHDISLIDWIAYDMIRQAAARGRPSPSLAEIGVATCCCTSAAGVLVKRLEGAGLVSRSKGWRSAVPAGQPPKSKPAPRRSIRTIQRQVKAQRERRLARIAARA
jgi:hypothetical protein